MQVLEASHGPNPGIATLRRRRNSSPSQGGEVWCDMGWAGSGGEYSHSPARPCSFTREIGVLTPPAPPFGPRGGERVRTRFSHSPVPSDWRRQHGGGCAPERRQDVQPQSLGGHQRVDKLAYKGPFQAPTHSEGICSCFRCVFSGHHASDCIGSGGAMHHHQVQLLENPPPMMIIPPPYHCVACVGTLLSACFWRVRAATLR